MIELTTFLAIVGIAGVIGSLLAALDALVACRRDSASAWWTDSLG